MKRRGVRTLNDSFIIAKAMDCVQIKQFVTNLVFEPIASLIS